MAPRHSRSICSLLLSGCLAISSALSGTDARPVDAGLTAHEWGTFTSIAGDKGQAVEWFPLTGSTDLPAFVEHFRETRCPILVQPCIACVSHDGQQPGPHIPPLISVEVTK